MVENNLSEDDTFKLNSLREKRAKLKKEIDDIKCQILDVTSRIQDLQQEVDKNTQSTDKSDRPLREAFALFNEGKYQDCFEKLLSESIIESLDSKHRATFLYEHVQSDRNSLDIETVHAYLFKPKNKDVLRDFIYCIDIKGCSLIDSVRQCFKKLHFKEAESDVISRIYSYISECYYETNSDEATKIFDTIGAVEFAAGAIVFLNTNLHNPNVKAEAKMSVEKFAECGQDPGISPKGISKEYMTDIYNEIKRNPLQLTFDKQAFSNKPARKQGYLCKEGGKYKTWKQRWFALYADYLHYYVHPDDEHPRGIVILHNLEVRKVNNPSRPFCFELVPAGNGDHTIQATKVKDGRKEHVQGKHKRYIMSAESEDERDAWIKAIRDTLKVDMIYALLAMRDNNRNTNC